VLVHPRDNDFGFDPDGEHAKQCGSWQLSVYGHGHERKYKRFETGNAGYWNHHRVGIGEFGDDRRAELGQLYVKSEFGKWI
jgi:hypothetical protein